MNYATIKPWDIANGPGVRVSVFVSGCTHRCKNCFNAEAWDFNYGEPFDEEQKNLRLRFRGSENQRLIDMPQTLKAGTVVLWDEEQ